MRFPMVLYEHESTFLPGMATLGHLYRLHRKQHVCVLRTLPLWLQQCLLYMVFGPSPNERQQLGIVP